MVKASDTTDPPATDPPATDPPATDPPPDGSTGANGGAGDGDELDARIKAKLSEILGTDDGATDPPAGGAVSDNTPPRSSSSTASIEENTRRVIREEQDRIAKENGRDAKIAELEGKVKSVTERPPIKQSKLSTFLWGKVDAE